MEEQNGLVNFPKIKSVEKNWEEIRNNLKFWGYVSEESRGGGVEVKRCCDGKIVKMLWMELLDAGLDKELMEAYFNEKQI